MPYPGYGDDHGGDQPGCFVSVVVMFVLVILFVVLKSCVFGNGPDTNPPANKTVTNSVDTKLARIPPGEFTMESPEDEADRLDGERHHRVRSPRLAFAQPVRSAPIHRGRAAESRERPHECGHYERLLTGSANAYIPGLPAAITLMGGIFRHIIRSNTISPAPAKGAMGTARELNPVDGGQAMSKSTAKRP